MSEFLGNKYIVGVSSPEVKTILDDLIEIIYHLAKQRVLDIVKNIERSKKKKEIIELVKNGVLRQTEIAKKLNVDRTTIRDHIVSINRYATKLFGVPAIRMTRKGLRPTIVFEYIVRELKSEKRLSN